MSNKPSIIDSFYNCSLLKLCLKKSIKNYSMENVLDNLNETELQLKIMEKLASDFPMLTLIWIANGERESIQWAISQNGKLEVSDVIPFDTTPDWFMWYPKEYPALKRKL